MSSIKGVEIQWLGHASFKLSYGGTVILVDPFLLDNPKCPIKSLNEISEHVDAILITHGHFDHVGDTLSLLALFPEAKVYCIHELTICLQTADIPSSRFIGMNKGGSVEFKSSRISGLGPILFTMVNASHSSSCNFPGAKTVQCGGAAAGFVITFPNGEVIYHSGDTDVFLDMQLISALYHPSIALLCIGGHYTMGPKEAAYALDHLLTSVTDVIPMHYGTFPVLLGTPDAFASQVKLRQNLVKIHRLLPGDTWIKTQ